MTLTDASANYGNSGYGTVYAGEDGNIYTYDEGNDQWYIREQVRIEGSGEFQGQYQWVPISPPTGADAIGTGTDTDTGEFVPTATDTALADLLGISAEDAAGLQDLLGQYDSGGASASEQQISPALLSDEELTNVMNAIYSAATTDITQDPSYKALTDLISGGYTGGYTAAQQSLIDQAYEAVSGKLANQGWTSGIGSSSIASAIAPTLENIYNTQIQSYLDLLGTSQASSANDLTALNEYLKTAGQPISLGANSGAYNFGTNQDQDSGISTTIGFDVGDILGAIPGLAALSDIRLKENISDADSGLDTIKKIDVKEYNYIFDQSKKRRYGVIAQELRNIMPDAVIDGPMLAVDYGQMIPVLILAVKELARKLEDINGKDKH